MKLTKVKKLVKNLHIVPSADMYEKTLSDTLRARVNSKKESSTVYKPNMWRIVVGSRTGGLAAAFFIISSLVTILIQSREVTNLRQELESARHDITTTRVKDFATINFYSREHQDIVAQHASLKQTQTRPLRIYVSQQDILYYELLDDQSAYMRPGIIVRGPSSQREINLPETPAISNGHTLTLSEAQETSAFNLVSPSWLHPCYKLGQIRRIDGRDVMQLLYTNGINSVSLFEQPLDGQRGLEPQDFREYAVYRNKEKVGGTILAWRDGALSYVLIGNIEMSQLMDMAQSISAGK